MQPQPPEEELEVEEVEDVVEVAPEEELEVEEVDEVEEVAPEEEEEVEEVEEPPLEEEARHMIGTDVVQAKSPESQHSNFLLISQ